MARTITCTCGHVLTGADDEELFRLGRQHANEAHADMNMSNERIREFIRADARDA
jgi:predicted small metal-binding protein